MSSFSRSDSVLFAADRLPHQPVLSACKSSTPFTVPVYLCGCVAGPAPTVRTTTLRSRSGHSALQSGVNDVVDLQPVFLGLARLPVVNEARRLVTYAGRSVSNTLVQTVTPRRGANKASRHVSLCRPQTSSTRMMKHVYAVLKHSASRRQHACVWNNTHILCFHTPG